MRNNTDGDGCATSSSSSGPGSRSSLSPSSSSSTNSPEEIAAVAIVRRQPTRRLHSKSRLGCFSCKRRRVKCDERRPLCAPCSRLGLACQYPPRGSDSAVVTAEAPRPSMPSLALEDLRFHYQFLTVAYPSLPLRGEDVWLQCAAMSHNYDYLAHAALGLGASHLAQNGTGNYTAQALQHRVKAIRLINEQLADPATKTLEQADALFAAMLCIIAQSSLIPDGMTEYVVITRGAHLVAKAIIPDYGRSIFKTFSADGHVESLRKMINDQPRDLSLIAMFQSSVMTLGPLCQKPHERLYYESLLKTITLAPNSSFETWLEYVQVFMMPSLMSNADFQAFIDPENHVGQLLLIHGFLLDYVLGRSFISPADEPKAPGRKNTIIAWTHGVMAALPAEYQSQALWLEQVCQVLSTQDARYLLSP